MCHCEPVLGEAIPKVHVQTNVGDCFVAKNSPRNDINFSSVMVRQTSMNVYSNHIDLTKSELLICGDLTRLMG